MFFDLHSPFPSPSHAFLSAAASSSASQTASSKSALKKSKKGKDREAASAPDTRPTSPAFGGGPKEQRDCWWGIADSDRQRVEESVLLSRHLGYNVLAFTQTAHTKIDSNKHHNPFASSSSSTSSISPFPQLDPLKLGGPRVDGGDALVQMSRMHIVLDDGSMSGSGPGFGPQNQNLLAGYDILSVQPTTLNTFTHACLNLTVPGPTQVSIITLSFPEGPKGCPFYLKRKPVLQALRNGAFFEIPYSPLLPSLSASTSQTSQARRNTLSLARDLIRITKGKGIILSSGGSEWGMVRNPGDVVGLGIMMGLSMDQARDAVGRSAKSVILRAQTRKTFKGLLSIPQVVLVDGATEEEGDNTPAPEKEGSTPMVVE